MDSITMPFQGNRDIKESRGLIRKLMRKGKHGAQ